MYYVSNIFKYVLMSVLDIELYVTSVSKIKERKNSVVLDARGVTPSPTRMNPRVYSLMGP